MDHEETHFFQPNACVKKQATGTGVESHLTFDKDGNPPKVFSAHFTCGGSGSFTG